MEKTMNATTKKLLEFDPIAAIEDTVGKCHENWNTAEETAAIILNMMYSEGKTTHLKGIGDTHCGITWSKFIDIAKNYGFECGYSQKFAGTGYSDHVEEEEIIFYHKEKGLILHAESFDAKSINSAKVYGEVKTTDKLTSSQLSALNGCSFGGNPNNTISFDVDVREGFVYHLEALSEAFEFSQRWSTVPFLWFLNYMDTEKPNYDYKKITAEKIAASSPEVSKIIYG